VQAVQVVLPDLAVVCPALHAVHKPAPVDEMYPIAKGGALTNNLKKRAGGVWVRTAIGAQSERRGGGECSGGALRTSGLTSNCCRRTVGAKRTSSGARGAGGAELTIGANKRR
jgi:hypothetical protein